MKNYNIKKNKFIYEMLDEIEYDICNNIIEILNEKEIQEIENEETENTQIYIILYKYIQ